MKRTLHRWLLLISLTFTFAENSLRLPPCPTSPQYFPQSLPMHCRMPRHVNPEAFSDLPQYPTLPPIPDSFFRSLPPDKQPPPIPIPIPPFPGMPMGPPGAPMPGPMPGMPMGPPGMPMPMPIVGGSPHKLPVIVMPFYSPDHSYKKPGYDHNDKGKRPHIPSHKLPHKHKKKKHYEDSDTDTDSSSDTDKSSSDGTSKSSSDGTSKGKSSESSSEYGFWRGRRSGRRHMLRRPGRRHRAKRKNSRNKKNLLTPILQYVTKDGYVIFEKKISKSEASDWLKPKTEISLVEERRDEKERDERQQVERQEREQAEREERQQAERNKRQKVEKERIEKSKKVEQSSQLMKARELRRKAEKLMEMEENNKEFGETEINGNRMIKVKKHRPMKVNALIN